MTFYNRIIPTGWIHAVFTPEDSIVIGGNFLHTLNIKTQLKVYDIEEATDVPLKFRFPFYKKINWYALEKNGIWLDQNKKLSKYEYESIVALAQFLRQDLIKDNPTLRADGTISNSIRKSHQVPDSIIDPIALTEHVENLAKKALEASSVKPKNIIRLVLNVNKPSTPPQITHQDDYEYDEEEEDEEEMDDDTDEEDDEYQEDPNAPIERNKMIPVFSNNDQTIKSEKKVRKKKKVTAVVEHKQYDSSSDDEDSMGTAKSKKSSLFANRKRSLSNNSNSSQPSTAKQRILGMINKRY